MSDDMRRVEAALETAFGKLDGLLASQQEIKLQLGELKTEWKHCVCEAEEVHKVVFGNGDPEKGLAARVPRLEEAERSRKWLTAVIIVAVITATVKSIVEAFSS